MNVRITHIDGNLPNLALMALSAFHRSRGDQIHFTKDVERGLFEPASYGAVYGSCIFERTRPRAERLIRANTGLYRIVKWDEYRRSTKSAESVAAFQRSKAATVESAEKTEDNR